MSSNSRRNIVEIEHDRVTNVASNDFPGHFPGEDHSWDLDKFKQSFKIDIKQLGDQEMNFDLIGIDTSIANAFRRIMIADVPSVAFESIYIYKNTGVIQDEILAQRIGLIPIGMNPDQLEWIDPLQPVKVDEEGNKQINMTSSDTVEFQLNVKCERNPDAPAGSTDPNELYINSNVYARDLRFKPLGDQETELDPLPTVCNPDILLAKLRPGQEIILSAYAVLGVGRDHAKFSPVATASYRLLPTIDIVGEPITGDLAKKFQKCFPPGVIDINKKDQAYVKDARKDTVSREVLRHEEFKGRVKLGRRRDHFIFNIESANSMQPDEIFVKSVRHLKNIAASLLQHELTL